jgi:hypothetical protein
MAIVCSAESVISRWPLVLRAVESPVNLLQGLAGFPDLGNKPGLDFGNLTQGDGRFLDDLTCFLGLPPQLLGRLPGAFMHQPQHLSREPRGFGVSPDVLLTFPQALLLLPALLGDHPQVFGADEISINPSRYFYIYLFFSSILMIINDIRSAITPSNSRRSEERITYLNFKLAHYA